MPSSAGRKNDHHAQTGAVVQKCHACAVAFGDGAHQRKPEAAAGPGAAGIEAAEGFEHGLARRGRNAGAGIGDAKAQLPGVADEPDPTDRDICS